MYHEHPGPQLVQCSGNVLTQFSNGWQGCFAWKAWDAAVTAGRAGCGPPQKHFTEVPGINAAHGLPGPAR